MAKKKTLKSARRSTAGAPSAGPVSALTIPQNTLDKYPALQDFVDRTWDTIPATHAFVAYALGLLTSQDDFLSLAATTTTDGSDDKNLDAILVDEDRIYICQGCLYDDWDRKSADSSKAATLSSAITWLLSAPLKEVPPRIRPRVDEVRQLIKAGECSELHIAFIHNAGESDAAATELDAVSRGAKTALPEAVTVHAIEIGLARLNSLFEAASADVLVREVVTLEVGPHHELAQDQWRALATVLTGTELKRLYDKYNDRLFSANVRDYLRIANRKGNVNRSIKNSAETDPDRFWTYNNGITMLTSKWTLDEDETKVKLEGLSIINGAQTTGVIGDTDDKSLSKLRIPTRVIECKNDEIVRNIVRFNNTQNSVKSFDLRSNDKVQSRLREEFEILSIEYVHRRRGSGRSAAFAIHAEAIAQLLAAFHGEFNTAIRRKADLFEEDSKYESIFSVSTTAAHVFLVQALADAIDKYKRDLGAKVSSGKATDAQEERLRFLEYSTAKQFIISIIGALAEEILGEPLTSRFAWRVADNRVQTNRASAIRAWDQAITALIPKIAHFARENPYKAVRSADSVKTIAKELAVDIEAFSTQYDPSFSTVRDLSEVSATSP